MVGTPINEVSEKLEYEVKPIISKYVSQHEYLYNAFYDAFSEFTNKASDVHFAGRSRFLNQPEFNNLDKVKEILNKFEDSSIIKEMTEEGFFLHRCLRQLQEIPQRKRLYKQKFRRA